MIEAVLISFLILDTKPFFFVFEAERLDISDHLPVTKKKRSIRRHFTSKKKKKEKQCALAHSDEHRITRRFLPGSFLIVIKSQFPSLLSWNEGIAFSRLTSTPPFLRPFHFFFHFWSRFFYVTTRKIRM